MHGGMSIRHILVRNVCEHSALKFAATLAYTLDAAPTWMFSVRYNLKASAIVQLPLLKLKWFNQ